MHIISHIIKSFSKETQAKTSLSLDSAPTKTCLCGCGSLLAGSVLSLTFLLLFLFNHFCISHCHTSREGFYTSSPTLNKKENGACSWDWSSLWLSVCWRNDTEAFSLDCFTITHRSPISTNLDHIISPTSCACARIGFPNRTISIFHLKQWVWEVTPGDMFETLNVICHTRLDFCAWWHVRFRWDPLQFHSDVMWV